MNTFERIFVVTFLVLFVIVVAILICLAVVKLWRMAFGPDHEDHY